MTPAPPTPPAGAPTYPALDDRHEPEEPAPRMADKALHHFGEADYRTRTMANLPVPF